MQSTLPNWSAFRLSDGWNISGPTTAAQPVFTTRITGSLVKARVQHLSDNAPAPPGSEEGQ
ncbi:hypothetical protein AAGT00_01125 (plasmid) [Streptomyces cavourensis]|uniref:hypothetical protein n=1 Tax=Streptomyces bacillaris TaxID=68179 RepID=UPI0036C6A621